MSDIIKAIIIFLLTVIASATAAYANNIEQKDTVAHLSSIQGADMTLYGLYAEHKDKDLDKAMGFAETFLCGIDSSAADPIVAEMLVELSRYFENKKFLYSKAITYTQRALGMYERLNDKYNIAACKFEIAKLCFRKRYYNLTLKYSTEALDYFQKDKNLKYILECYNLLGIVYYACQEYDISNEYFRKYAEGARQLSDSAQMLLSINNSAVFTSNIVKDTAKTRQLINESIDIARNMRDSSYLMTMYINLINSYLSVGDTGKVPALLDETGKIAKDIRQKGQHYYTTGTYYIETGQYEKAEKMLKLALDNFGKGEFEYEVKKCLSALHYTYSKLGDYKSAYEAIIQYYEIENQSSVKDSYIALFKAQNEIILQEERDKLERQRNLQIFFGTAGTLCLIIVFLTVYFYIRKRSLIITQKEIQLENKRLQNLNLEQEMKSQAEIMEIKKMQQYQMDRMIEDVIDKMEKINFRIQDRKTKDEINAVCNDLRHTKDGSQWKEVTQFIPEFNSNFFINLLKDFPDLTINERRLCALLNLNMTTKEISEITRQSINSINTARGRLRNKLGLTGGSISIQEFLSRYNTPKE